MSTPEKGHTRQVLQCATKSSQPLADCLATLSKSLPHVNKPGAQYLYAGIALSETILHAPSAI